MEERILKDACGDDAVLCEMCSEILVLIVHETDPMHMDQERMSRNLVGPVSHGIYGRAGDVKIQAAAFGIRVVGELLDAHIVELNFARRVSLRTPWFRPDIEAVGSENRGGRGRYRGLSAGGGGSSEVAGTVLVETPQATETHNPPDAKVLLVVIFMVVRRSVSRTHPY